MKKIITELGHSDSLKNYMDLGIEVHADDLFSETTVTMVLKFHMQHNKAAGLQNDQESKMPAVA